MSYFLKISHIKKGTYLQIYESYRDKKRKCSAQKSFKALGYVDDLIATGIDDPIAYYKNEVSKMNKKVKKEKDRIINLSSKSKITSINDVLNLCIDNYILKEEDVKKLLNYKI